MISFADYLAETVQPIALPHELRHGAAIDGWPVSARRKAEAARDLIREHADHRAVGALVDEAIAAGLQLAGVAHVELPDHAEGAAINTLPMLDAGLSPARARGLVAVCAAPLYHARKCLQAVPVAKKIPDAAMALAEGRSRAAGFIDPAVGGKAAGALAIASALDRIGFAAQIDVIARALGKSVGALEKTVGAEVVTVALRAAWESHRPAWAGLCVQERQLEAQAVGFLPGWR